MTLPTERMRFEKEKEGPGQSSGAPDGINGPRKGNRERLSSQQKGSWQVL